jgi:prevent-host-death family protein
MLVISSREFRQHQKEYFEKVDQGEQVIVQRGNNKAYVLTPVFSDDLLINTGMIEKLKQSLLEVQNGEVQKISYPNEIKDLLGL